MNSDSSLSKNTLKLIEDKLGPGLSDLKTAQLTPYILYKAKYNSKGKSIKQASRQRRRVENILQSILSRKNENIKLQVTYQDSLADFEKLIVALLDHTIAHDVVNTSVRVTTSGHFDISLTIETPYTVDDELIAKQVSDTIEPIAKRADLTLRTVLITTNTNDRPGNMAVLRAYRVKSPASIESIRDYLSIRLGRPVNKKDVQRVTDSLRKEGLLQYNYDGMHIITLKGIRYLPGSSKDPRSIDVERLLDLARRNW